MATRRDIWRPTVRTEVIGPATVLTVSGRLGDAGARDPAVRAAQTYPSATRALILDISGVDYVSSPGLAVLETLAADAAATGRVLVVCGVTDPVRVALDLSGVSGTLTCVTTLHEAMARVEALMAIP